MPFLPQELIDDIFDHLWFDKDTLESVSQVSTSARRTAFIHIYSSVQLYTAISCYRFFRRTQVYPDILRYVQSLKLIEVNKDKDDLWLAGALVILSPILENVVHLTLTGCDWNEIVGESRQSLINGFQTATRLTLRSCKVPPDGFDKLIRSFPRLHQLDLDNVVLTGVGRAVFSLCKLLVFCSETIPGGPTLSHVVLWLRETNCWSHIENLSLECRDASSIASINEILAATSSTLKRLRLRIGTVSGEHQQAPLVIPPTTRLSHLFLDTFTVSSFDTTTGVGTSNVSFFSISTLGLDFLHSSQPLLHEVTIAYSLTYRPVAVLRSETTLINRILDMDSSTNDSTTTRPPTAFAAVTHMNVVIQQDGSFISKKNTFVLQAIVEDALQPFQKAGSLRVWILDGRHSEEAAVMWRLRDSLF